MKDIYPGNDLSSGRVPPTPEDGYIFHVVADADPDVLLRVASQLLLSNVVPFNFVMTSESQVTVHIEAELRGITFGTAEAIRRKLLQLSCAVEVEMQHALIAGVR
jgi:hypothetical protein